MEKHPVHRRHPRKALNTPKETHANSTKTQSAKRTRPAVDMRGEHSVVALLHLGCEWHCGLGQKSEKRYRGTAQGPRQRWQRPCPSTSVLFVPPQPLPEQNTLQCLRKPIDWGLSQGEGPGHVHYRMLGPSPKQTFWLPNAIQPQPPMSPNAPYPDPASPPSRQEGGVGRVFAFCYWTGPYASSHMAICINVRFVLCLCCCVVCGVALWSCGVLYTLWLCAMMCAFYALSCVFLWLCDAMCSFVPKALLPIWQRPGCLAHRKPCVLLAGHGASTGLSCLLLC